MVKHTRRPRIILLDTDVLVAADLRDLWDIFARESRDDQWLGVAADAQGAITRCGRLGSHEGFSTAVMIWDVVRMRANGMFSAFVDPAAVAVRDDILRRVVRSGGCGWVLAVLEREHD